MSQGMGRDRSEGNREGVTSHRGSGMGQVRNGIRTVNKPIINFLCTGKN